MSPYQWLMLTDWVTGQSMALRVDLIASVDADPHYDGPSKHIGSLVGTADGIQHHAREHPNRVISTVRAFFEDDE